MKNNKLKEIDIVNNIKGKKLCNFKMVSFYLSKELISKNLMAYLEFEATWISIVIAEEVTTLREVSLSEVNEFIKFTNDKGTLFEYPINNYNHFVIEFIGLKLIDIKKLFYRDDLHDTNGLVLYFENNKNIILIGEYEDEIKITFDKEDIPSELIEMDI